MILLSRCEIITRQFSFLSRFRRLLPIVAFCSGNTVRTPALSPGKPSSVFILVSSPRFLLTHFSLYPHPSRPIEPTQGYENREQGLLIWSKRTGFFVVHHCLYSRKPGNATFRRNEKIKERKVLDQFCTVTHTHGSCERCPNVCLSLRRCPALVSITRTTYPSTR